MKKIIVFFLALAFFAPSFIFAEGTGDQATSSETVINPEVVTVKSTENVPVLISAPVVKPTTTLINTKGLEKISSPEQIKNFREVRKVGDVLYGIRIQKLQYDIKTVKDIITSSIAKVASSSDKAVAVKSEVKKLEKIATPAEISMYEKIQKVGNSLFGIRKATKENLGVAQLSSDAVVCLKAAIDKKDTAINSALNAQSSTLVQAVTDRGVCQKTAFDLSGNNLVVSAFKVCKDNFNKAVKVSREANNKERDGVWKNYLQDVKACYLTNYSTSSTEITTNGNLLLDDGGNNLSL